MWYALLNVSQSKTLEPCGGNANISRNGREGALFSSSFISPSRSLCRVSCLPRLPPNIVGLFSYFRKQTDI